MSCLQLLTGCFYVDEMWLLLLSSYRELTGYLNLVERNFLWNTLFCSFIDCLALLGILCRCIISLYLGWIHSFYFNFPKHHFYQHPIAFPYFSSWVTFTIYFSQYITYYYVLLMQHKSFHWDCWYCSLNSCLTFCWYSFRHF